MAPKAKIAGKLEGYEAALACDAMIREKNDGERIIDAQIVKNVKDNKEELFKQQSEFIAEYRRRLAAAD